MAIKEQMFAVQVRRTVDALKDGRNHSLLGQTSVDIFMSRLMDTSSAGKKWNEPSESRELTELIIESICISLFSRLLGDKGKVTLDYIYNNEFVITMDQAKVAIVAVLTENGVEDAGCVVDRALSWMIQYELLSSTSDKEVYTLSKTAVGKIAVELGLVDAEEASKRQLQENVLKFIKEQTTSFTIGYGNGKRRVATIEQIAESLNEKVEDIEEALRVLIESEKGKLIKRVEVEDKIAYYWDVAIRVNVPI